MLRTTMQYAIVDSTLQAATQLVSVDLEPWVHDLDPVAIKFWKITIRWYALAYIVGLLAAWKIALRLSKETFHAQVAIVLLMFQFAFHCHLPSRS